jgi:hypothetical protein
MPVNSMAPNAKFDFFGKKSSRDHSKCPHCGHGPLKDIKGFSVVFVTNAISVKRFYNHLSIES